jgi:phage baseplate assembly protein V
MIGLIDTRIARALARVRLAFRGVLTRLNTAPAVQLAQADALSGEQLQDAELMQHYGFTSAPPAGTMVVVLPLGGQTAHGIIIATEHASYRLRGLQSGEVALYTDEGDHVVLHRGRVVEIVAGTKLRVVSPMLECTGEIKDRCDSDGRTMSGMRAIYNAHTHSDPQGGSVSTPSGTM